MSIEVKKIENVFDITTILLGAIEPLGESNIDGVRFENLTQTIEITEDLIDKIIMVARHKDRHEFSMNKAGKEADKFIDRLRERLT